MAKPCVPPNQSRTYQSPPTVEQYKIGGFPGAFSNAPLNLNPPRRTLILKGNDGGGSTSNVYLSFTPIATQPDGVTPAVTGQGVFKTFQFAGAGSGSLLGSDQFVTFRKPMGGTLFISSFDTGEPGSYFWFIATDDWVPNGISVVDDNFTDQ
jgi:hypothetical protein